jgi:DNA segregation ATPase FtsK/SpoIIIE, S-DNA-T family
MTQRSRPSKTSRTTGRTTGRTSGRAAGSSAGSSRSGRPAPTSRKGAASGKSTGGRGAGAADTVQRSVGEAFFGHGRDVAGVVVAVTGLVAGLGLYVDLAGPVGRGLAALLLALVGLLAYIVPPVMVVGGVFLLRRRGDEESTSVRPVVGGVLLGFAFAGLLHLVTGGAGLGAPVDELESSGGYIGALLTAPLTGLLGIWAAALVLVAVAVIGAVVVTDRSLHEVGELIMRILRPVGRLIARGWHALFTLGDEDPIVNADGEAVSAAEAATAPLVVADGEVIDSTLDNQPDADAASDAAKGMDDDLTPDWLRPAADAMGSADAAGAAAAAGAGVVVAADIPAAPAWLEAAAESDADDDADSGPPEQLTIDLGPGLAPTPWKLPKARLLERSDRHEVDTGEVERRGRLLEQALAEHGVETRLVGMVVGPTVTRFELELGPGVKVARVTSLNRDIAYAMASPDVRILAPIPGRQAIGVEVPNIDRQVVSLGDVLASEEAHRATNALDVALGRDINGKNILVDLATMPHLLIAGQTGAGKSSCINSLITSVLMRTTPDQVKMILIDPKRVELGQYNRLPHLLTQVVTNPKKAANALSWAVREMERRYDLLSETGFRDIGGYNAAFDRGELNGDGSHHDDAIADGFVTGDASTGDASTGDPRASDPASSDATGTDPVTADAVDNPQPQLITSAGAADNAAMPEFQRLPLLLIVVDELNDLMMVAARDVEDSICRIAQMARAVGIHLVVATQRPSVNVITGTIKANIPSRLAFAVASLADSRVILDQPGAERLVGQGDMLLVGASSSIAQRVQGCWVSEREVRAVVGHWRRQAPDLAFDDTAVQGSDDAVGPGVGGSSGAGDDDDELLVQATELVVRSQMGSTSMLQRKLRVGFARAGRLMDLMEQRGIVGPSEGSKARAVLMSPEELDGATDAAWSDESIGFVPGSHDPDAGAP